MSQPPDAPSDRRAAALERLKQQIAEQRSRLDPKLLELAQKAALLSQKPAESRAEDSVPYDRAAAAEAIRLFLTQHPDAKAFEAALMDMLRRDRH